MRFTAGWAWTLKIALSTGISRVCTRKPEASITRSFLSWRLRETRKRSTRSPGKVRPTGLHFSWNFSPNFPLKRGLSARFLFLFVFFFFFFQQPFTDAKPPRNNYRNKAGTRAVRTVRGAWLNGAKLNRFSRRYLPGEIRGPINEINEYRFQSATRGHSRRLANRARFVRLTERVICNAPWTAARRPTRQSRRKSRY